LYNRNRNLFKYYYISIYKISMRASKNEAPSTNIDQKMFSLYSLKTPSMLDTIITFLPKLEREILVLFIVKKSDLTAKHVERIIQSAYLFNAADFVVKEELKKGHKINKLLFKDAPYFSEFVYYFYAVARYPADETYYGIEHPKDMKIPEEDTNTENLTKFFIAEEDTTAESKRLKLVSEANKVVPKAFAIPSYKKINAALFNLLMQNYIWSLSKKKKVFLSISADLLDVWLKRFEQISKELMEKIKEINSESEAHTFIIKKYGPIVYEFFLFSLLNAAYFVNKGSLLILKYKNEIATYTPY